MAARTRGGAVLRVLFLAVLVGAGVAAYRYINRPDPAADAGKALEDLRTAALKSDVATCWASASPELQEEAIVRAKALATCDPLYGKGPELLQVNLRLVKFPVPTVKSPCVLFGDTRICRKGSTWQLAALAFDRTDTPASECAPEPKPPEPLTTVEAPPDAPAEVSDADLLRVAFPRAEGNELGEGLYLVESTVQRYQDDVAFVGVITAAVPKPSATTSDESAPVTGDYCRQQPFAAELIALRKGDQGWQTAGRLPLEEPPHGSACPSLELKVETPHLTGDLISVVAKLSAKVDDGDAPDSPMLLAALRADELIKLIEYSQSSNETVAISAEPNADLPDLRVTRTDSFDGTSHDMLYSWNGQQYEQVINPVADMPNLDPSADTDPSAGY